MPVDYSKYPPNWKTIVDRIKKRANGKCEFCYCLDGKPHPITKSKVILQIMHLDHDPENWNIKDSRLRAACQRCHTNYDKIEKHKKNKSVKKKKYKSNQENIFYDIYPAQSDKDRLYELFNKRPTKRRRITISEYAETTVIPSGKYRGVMFRNDRAPYMIEPMDCMGPESNIQQCMLLFPAQSGKTTIAEMVGMYYIEIIPSEILYVGSTAEQVKKWFYKRIEGRCHKKGIEFTAQTEDKKIRRSGNTIFAKQFPGGDLDLASSGSASQLASETKRVLLADEVDRWKSELGEEGKTVNIVNARMQAWGDQKKGLYFSTPTTYDESLIWPLYEEGDQRQYWVECPLCKEVQLLTLYVLEKHGLYWETKAGKLDYSTIHYLCRKCGQTGDTFWKENLKNKVLNSGIWKPQVEPKTPFIRSYQINGIYSPFLPWSDIALAWIDSEGDPIGRKDFHNLKMGMPYREIGSRPKAQKLIEQKGSYHVGTVPDGVLYLTIGADVQEGAHKYRGMSQAQIEKIASEQDIKGNYSDLPRIELEILGIGAGYRSWSIDYKRFEGAIDNPFEGAWERLHTWAVNGGLEFKRKDGHIFYPELIFIDSGCATDIVYRFCQRWKNTYPSKGFGFIKRQKNEKKDERTEYNFKRYRPTKINEDILIYTISTNYYKTQIYNTLKTTRQDYKIQKAGFCEFPFEYGQVGTVYEKYFDMLTAEEKKRDGSFDAGGRRNESLDVRAYALCASDVFLDGLVMEYKGAAKTSGSKPDQIRKIDHRWVLELLKKESGNVLYYEK